MNKFLSLLLVFLSIFSGSFAGESTTNLQSIDECSRYFKEARAQRKQENAAQQNHKPPLEKQLEEAQYNLRLAEKQNLHKSKGYDPDPRDVHHAKVLELCQTRVVTIQQMIEMVDKKQHLEVKIAKQQAKPLDFLEYIKAQNEIERLTLLLSK